MTREYDIRDVSTSPREVISAGGSGWETTVLYDTSEGRMSARLPGALTNADAIKSIISRRKAISQRKEDADGD